MWEWMRCRKGLNILFCILGRWWRWKDNNGMRNCKEQLRRIKLINWWISMWELPKWENHHHTPSPCKKTFHEDFKIFHLFQGRSSCCWSFFHIFHPPLFGLPKSLSSVRLPMIQFCSLFIFFYDQTISVDIYQWI